MNISQQHHNLIQPANRADALSIKVLIILNFLNVRTPGKNFYRFTICLTDKTDLIVTPAGIPSTRYSPKLLESPAVAEPTVELCSWGDESQRPRTGPVQVSRLSGIHQITNATTKHRAPALIRHGSLKPITRRPNPPNRVSRGAISVGVFH